MPIVEVTISNEGEVKVDAQEVKGSGCAALTKAIEQAIGTTTSDRKKPEFTQQAGQGNQGNPATAGQ